MVPAVVVVPSSLPSSLSSSLSFFVSSFSVSPFSESSPEDVVVVDIAVVVVLSAVVVVSDVSSDVSDVVVVRLVGTYDSSLSVASVNSKSYGAKQNTVI